MSIEENKAIVRRWSAELFNQRHLAVADEIVAPTYVRHNPGDPYASYWSARIGAKDFRDIVWSFREPLPACLPIDGLLCFFNERVDAIYVDDELLPKPITKWS